MKHLVTAAALITAALIMSVGLNLKQAGRLSALAQQLADTEGQRDQARRETKQLRVRQADLVRRLQAAEQTAAAERHRSEQALAAESRWAAQPLPDALRRQTDIRTHADLVRALVAERAAFDQCKAARDTLAACLENENP